MKRFYGLSVNLELLSRFLANEKSYLGSAMPGDTRVSVAELRDHKMSGIKFMTSIMLFMHFRPLSYLSGLSVLFKKIFNYYIYYLNFMYFIIGVVLFMFGGD